MKRYVLYLSVGVVAALAIYGVAYSYYKKSMLPTVTSFVKPQQSILSVATVPRVDVPVTHIPTPAVVKAS
jgi:hypothetical protein